MNYETAKKLKDAGYAMPTLGGEVGWNDGDGKGVYKAPTLEELIESCGNDFYSLTFTGETYTATGLGDKIGVTGPTPIIAVANLWLELNKKHDPS